MRFCLNMRPERKRWLLIHGMRLTTKYAFAVLWVICMIGLAVTFPSVWDKPSGIALGMNCLLLPGYAVMFYWMTTQYEALGFYDIMLKDKNVLGVWLQ